MRNYILWTKPEEPLINRERYIWFHDNTYFLWDGYTWVDVNSQTGRIDSSALPDNVVYDNDITALNEIPGIKASMPKVFQIYLNLMDANLRPGTPVGGRYNPSTGQLDGDIISEISDGTTTKTNAEAGDNTEVRHWSTRKQWVENAFSWYSIGTFTAGGSIIGTWSDPIPVVIGRDGINGIDGKNGVDGVDGVNMEFIFTLLTGDEQFQEIATPYSNPDVTDYVPTLENEGSVDVDWFDHPQGISREFQIEAMCYRKKNYSTGKWGVWVGPTKWSIWGETGKDGDGIEYIFRLTTEDEITEDGQLQSRFWPPTTQAQVDAIGEAYQHDDWYPANLGWDDDPKDVTNEKKYQFVAKRKYKGEVGTGGTWLPFSTPTLWDKYVLADVKGFTAFAFTRTNEDISQDTCTGGDASRYPWPSQTTTPQGAIRQVTWHDTVPTNSAAQLWMVQRFFSDDSELESSWTKPVRWGDSSNLNIEYSNDYPWDTMPALPRIEGSFIDDSPEGFNEELWRDYCASLDLGHWSDELENPKYMAVAYKKNDAWEDWTISKIAGENGISYREFSLYISFNDPNSVPQTPVNGNCRWDIENGNDTLVNIPANWSLTCPDTSTDNLFVWESKANFRSDTGNISGSWSSPNRVNQLNIVVESDITYYKADASDTGVTAPALTAEPESATYKWWQNDNSTYYEAISPEKPYLWSFRRVIYSNGFKTQSKATIIRYLNDAISQEVIDSIAHEVEGLVSDDINSLNKRLSSITGGTVYTGYDKRTGLVETLCSYKDAGTTRYSDLIVDASKAKINANVGSTLGALVTGASQTLDGVAGAINASTTKLDGITGTVKNALQSITTDAITSVVSTGNYVWVGYESVAVNANETGEIERYAPTYYTTSDSEVQAGTKNVTDIKNENKPANTTKTKDWRKEYQAGQMSAIKQESDAVRAFVTDENGNLAAGISILKNLEVRNVGSGSAIVLEADHIILDGLTLANALNANTITITGGNLYVQDAATNPTHITQLTPNALITNCAQIQGNLFTDAGFFGTVSQKSGGPAVTVAGMVSDFSSKTVYNWSGVGVNGTGLRSTNYNGTNAGFDLGGSNFTFFGPNGTKISSSEITITGAITATSGKIGKLSIASNGDLTHDLGTFSLLANGTLSLTGEVNASSGSITGNLRILNNGQISCEEVSKGTYITVDGLHTSDYTQTAGSAPVRYCTVNPSDGFKTIRYYNIGGSSGYSKMETMLSGGLYMTYTSDARGYYRDITGSYYTSMAVISANYTENGIEVSTPTATMSNVFTDEFDGPIKYIKYTNSYSTSTAVPYVLYFVSD